MMPIRTILHPTDLSGESMAAFRLACAMAHDHAARLVLLTVYPPPIGGAEAIDRDRPNGIDQDLLAQLRQLVPDPAVPIEYRVEEGRPAGVILDVAAEIGADLIVMGTHGRSGIGRALMGSVAEAVNRKATCLVATVRGPSRAAAVPAVAAAAPGTAGNIANAEAGPEDWRDAPGGGDPTREVAIPVGPVTLRGTLRWAGQPRGVVVFAHGSGSSRHSPRNQFVAGALVDAGFATLLLDLLTEDEAEDRENVFDIALLAERLAGAAEWVVKQPEMAGLPVGYFGASTGSAAALVAAARSPRGVKAVVSRGGRPDLAWDDLPAVKASTLLIVGGDDEPVVTWNRDALQQLNCTKDLAVVPGATHLFEEPGTLETVAQLAGDWFTRHLAPGKTSAGTTKSQR